ncbi:MAG: hypothetical protein P8Q14_09420 [Vicingaceae bacterium]|nr:hypothetical protein [Vicingaceae bacterium]
MNPSRYIPDITIFDYGLGFFYIVMIYLVAFAYKSKKELDDDNYQLYLYALSVKIFGGLGFMFLTVYYWGGGDTYSYFNTGRDFLSHIMEDPLERLKLYFSSVENMNWYKYEFAYNRHSFLGSGANFATVKITSIINFFCFQSYVVSTIMFSLMSFFGVWNMYYVFCRIYPHLKKPLFYGFFFIPSVILWGSGILKDTITLASMGWLVYSFINLIIFKRKKFLSFVIILIATITIASIKPYILYVLYPCLFIWVQGNLKMLIKSNLFRKLLAPFIALVLVVSSFFLAEELSQGAGKYNLDRIEGTLEGFQTWHTTVSETKHQSGYTLGDDMDFTTIGIMKKIPAAIAVTFFRPYPWEVYNASTLLGAIEGMILIGFSLWLVLKYRLKLFQLIFRNKDISFLLLFSIIFGISVGISSYNFGALSRYKIPAQMFFVIALILIYDKTNKQIR